MLCRGIVGQVGFGNEGDNQIRNRSVTPIGMGCNMIGNGFDIEPGIDKRLIEQRCGYTIVAVTCNISGTGRTGPGK